MIGRNPFLQRAVAEETVLRKVSSAHVVEEDVRNICKVTCLWFFSTLLEINAGGAIAGMSEINQADPTTGNPEYHAVLWQDDKIQDLGTLGGTASLAFSLNNHGKITGESLNGVP